MAEYVAIQVSKQIYNHKDNTDGNIVYPHIVT